MDLERELKSWLNRSEKGFEQNLDFATRAWTCVELVYQRKHEVIVQWFCEKFPKYVQEQKGSCDWDRIKKFLGLQFHGGLITDETKGNLIKAVSLAAISIENSSDSSFIEVLIQLSGNASFQSFYKADFEAFSALQTALLSRINVHLQKNFSHSHATKIMEPVIKNLVEFVRRPSALKVLADVFMEKALPAFVELVIYLGSQNLNYFSELLEIETTLYFANDKCYRQLSKYSDEYLYVVLKNYECIVRHHIAQTDFLKQFIAYIFKDPDTMEKELIKTSLIKIGHVLNLLRKYEINLRMEMEEKLTAISFLSRRIEAYVSEYHNLYLREILVILCNTIQLNPLILERNFFSLAVKCIFCRKTDDDWNKYEEFLILFINMYKKINRPETLVRHLVKEVRNYIENNKLSKKLKRKADIDDSVLSTEPPNKVKLIEEDNKKTIKTAHPAEFAENNRNTDFYLRSVLQESSEPVQRPLYQMEEEWPNISYAWPGQTAGLSFSAFISTLMSKQSLVTWKTLIFNFKENLESLNDTEPTENTLFLIEFYSALLCQYLAGSCVAEQSNILWADIEKAQVLTHDLLRDFGKWLLNTKHNKRTMNAFLKLCYHVGSFDLIAYYYCADSIKSRTTDFDKKPANMYSYLTPDEWTLIEQRVVNFGKSACKYNANRLHLQKAKSRHLFSSDNNFNIKKSLLSSSLSDPDQLNSLLQDDHNTWLLKCLNKEQKHKICERIIESMTPEDIRNAKILLDNHEFLESFALILFKKIADSFESKKSSLKAIDFEAICNELNEEHLKSLVTLFNEKTKLKKIKNYSSENIEKGLQVLQNTSLGFCRRTIKEFIFICNILLYEDLLRAKEETISSLCLQLFDNLLHFGQPIQIVEQMDIEKLIKIIQPSQHPSFYELLTRNLVRITDQTHNFLEKITKFLSEDPKDFSADKVKLLVVVLENLPQIPLFQKLKKVYSSLLQILLELVKNFFEPDVRDRETDKAFVDQTVLPFTALLNSLLVEGDSTENNALFRKACKIYIGHSINSYKESTVKLLNTTLSHRSVLNITPEEVQFILQRFWSSLVKDLSDDNIETTEVESIVQSIVQFQSDDALRILLAGMLKDLKPDSFELTSKILHLIGGRQLKPSKYTIFNEYFKVINFQMILHLKKDCRSVLENKDVIFQILRSYRTLCENRKIAITSGVFDDMLLLLVDIDMKKFPTDDEATATFQKLHDEITEICIASLKTRQVFVMDRIPQFISVVKDLIQSICWYKSDREKDSNLNADEVEELSKMAHKIENLTHFMAKSEIEFKKVAPYLLIFIMSLMVSNKRSTTLYPKIKTHIENSCHNLISICDPKVENFILRNCNEAAKQVYETLSKEYKKYRKFKGKV